MPDVCVCVCYRLLSATVEYEETGWYDGQVWVKTPQMLMRDRLLGTYQVRAAHTHTHAHTHT